MIVNVDTNKNNPIIHVKADIEGLNYMVEACEKAKMDLIRNDDIRKVGFMLFQSIKDE